MQERPLPLLGIIIGVLTISTIMSPLTFYFFLKQPDWEGMMLTIQMTIFSAMAGVVMGYFIQTEIQGAIKKWKKKE